MTDDRPLPEQGAHRALLAVLLLERYGPPPVRELRRPARPRVPWSPATLRQIAERRRVLLDALDDIDQTYRRGAA